jgi:hypothetical protein
MIKEIFFTLSLLFISQISFGQYLVGPRLSGGILHVVEGKNAPSDVKNSTFKPVYSLGGVFNFKIKKNFSLNTELNFTRKTKTTIDDLNSKITFNNLHVDAPILLRLQVNAQNYAFGDYQYFFEVGPELSYWLMCTGKISGSAADTSFTIKFKGKFKEDVSPEDELFLTNANRFQFGLVFGTGLAIPVMTDQILILEFRYQHGQTLLGGDINSYVGGYRLRDSLYGNYRSFTISASLLFKTGLFPSKKGKSTIKN